MLFNSWHFLFFFPVVAVVFYRLPNVVLRQRWLLLASLYFYGSYKVEYLALLIGATSIDWSAAIGISRAKSQTVKRSFLAASLISNLSILGYFKYYNFFVSALPVELPFSSLLLPVGISFYTFQAMSYVIDVYRGDAEPIQKFPRFLLYITFFPQLVAGPIERSHFLAPQFDRFKRFKDVDLGAAATLIVMGFFKKVVIADRIAPYVDKTYQLVSEAHSVHVVIAVFFFAIQLYCDFSGYTDIARGCAKLLGFDLSINFLRPYLARNTKELLQRWHITLSNFLKHYVFFPLGGNKRGKWITGRNYLIVMILSGIWHGASLNFVLWGVILAITIWVVVNTPPLPIPDGFKRFISFVYAAPVLILFRAKDLEEAGNIFRSMFTKWNVNSGMASLFGLSMPYIRAGFSEGYFAVSVALVGFWYWVERREEKEKLTTSIVATMFIFLIFFGRFNGRSFIYFNF
jgi:alginate O-acetyltransferase complex protein AlgI